MANADMPSRVLSIDGDGVRGIVPARVLVELEQLGAPISEQFDLIAGSGSGAIMALALSARGRRWHSRLRAAELLDLWVARAHRLSAATPPPSPHAGPGAGTPGAVDRCGPRSSGFWLDPVR